MEYRTSSRRDPNIEANKENNENLIKALYDIFTKNSPKEDIDKLKAAYALNMCTVSISQIVDYNDINILEQEYDAILNNLNLEQMPKDEALLRILKQILDTITYFRIEEVEKEFIEKEYQQKMKNAIWSAVPNFGIIISRGNPITAVISLASQVGIGYMNYRKNKAECDNGKEKQMWQLRKTAIEQFNGLRRELFDTAWRLADEYDFPDEYRLTEKQIAQYNKILMDNDEIRKHERLYSIKDKFKAYPPFWYYIGNTAKRISESDDETVNENEKADFALKARGYFEEFFKLNKYNILREDQIAASGSLEYAEILLKDDNPDKAKISECIDKARALCGNAFDVLQLCSVLYLKNNEADKASEILRILVNEDYNRIINAQLLSSIYVKEGNKKDYELLITRVDKKYLYPMDGNNIAFKNNQKAVLANKFATCLSNFFNKYAIEWNKIIPVFENENYSDSFFAYTTEAKEYRLCESEKIFKDKNESYKNRLRYCDYQIKLLDVVNEAFDKIFSFEPLKNDELIEKAKDCILKKFEACKDKYIDLSTKINEGKFSEDDYRESQSDELSIVHIFEDTIIMLSKHLSKIIRSANIENLTEIDGKLSEFCSLNGLSYPETCDNKLTVSHPSVNSNAFSLQKIFGESISHSKHKIDFTNEIIECIKSHVTDKNKTSNILFTRDTQEFTDYFDNTDFRKKIGNTLESIKQNSIAIYKDEKFDLHLTIKGIIAVNKTVRITPISRRKILEIFLYKEVKIDNDRIILTQYVYPIPPSIADIFKKIISDINRIAAKYKPADEKEDHTAIGELLSALRWNIDNDFEYSTLDELKTNFSYFGNHELEEMLYSGQFKENIKWNNALKNVLKERGYADDYIDSLEN